MSILADVKESIRNMQEQLFTASLFIALHPEIARIAGCKFREVHPQFLHPVFEFEETTEALRERIFALFPAEWEHDTFTTWEGEPAQQWAAIVDGVMLTMIAPMDKEEGAPA